MSQYANVVKSRLIHADVLRMYMENTVRKLHHRLQIIHLLPDHVRRVVVQTQVGTADVLEHATPNRWRSREVFTTRPFILRKEHRAILNADPHSLIFGEFDERLPG